MAGLPWFKLAGDFFSHPKTLELQAELADPCADVYVVRMWAYVSRVAASGRLTGRNVVTVLERAVCWQGEPGRLVSALLAVGFLEQEPDALVVHDWASEQGAHVAKVERDRARPRADKRISHLSPVPARESRGHVAESREGPEVEMKREIESKKETTTLSAPADQPPGEELPDATENAHPVLLELSSAPAETPEAFQALWNAVTTPPIPKWLGMSKPRRAAALQRLRERPLAEWRRIIERVNASTFCRGENDRGWRADPEFILRPDSADKVLEGKYDRNTPPRNSGSTKSENKTGGYTMDDFFKRQHPAAGGGK